MYIDSTTAWKVASRTHYPRVQSAVITMQGIPGGPDPIVNSIYSTGLTFVQTLTTLNGTNLQYDTGCWVTVPGKTCGDEVLRVRQVACNTVIQPVVGCVPCPVPQQTTIPIHRLVNGTFANLPADRAGMFSAGSPIIGHSLAVMAGMNYDSFTQWAPAQTIFSTNDKVNSYFSLVNIRSTATMYMQMLYNAPHDIYGSLRHIYLCNKEDHYPVPTNIVYDDYHGTIDDMVKLAQRISNSYNTNGVLAKYLNVKDSLAAPNGGSASSIDAAAYADINLNGAKELQQQLKSAVDQAIEGTHEASSQTVGGTYNHSPAQVISLAGVPIYLMMNVLRKYTSFGYQNALGYQLGYLVDALVKCFTQGIVINEASPGRLHLVTSTFSPLFPYIPTSFPNMTYTADLDNRPNYTIDRAGQVIPDVQPFDVYPYISAEEIQPSAYLVVQDEYADVINALNK